MCSILDIIWRWRFKQIFKFSFANKNKIIKWQEFQWNEMKTNGIIRKALKTEIDYLDFQCGRVE